MTGRIALRFWWPKSRAEFHGALWTVVAAALIIVAANVMFNLIDSYAGRVDVLKAREPIRSTQAKGPLVDLSVLDSGTGELVLYRVGTAPADTTLPPGLSSWPKPGQVALSPGAAKLREDNPYVALLTPGVATGSVIREGLRDPEEAVAFVGMTDAEARAVGAVPTRGFGAASSSVEDLSAGQTDFLSLWSGLLVVFGGSTLAFVVARLASPGRQRRLAVLLLLGSPPRVVTNVARLTMAATAIVGSLVGYLIAVPVASATSRAEFFGVSRWTSGAVSRPGVLLAVAVLSVATMAYLAGRTVDIDPWAVRRRVPDAKTSLLRLVPLSAGLLALAAVLVAQRRHANQDIGTPVNTVMILLAAVVVILVGLIVAGPLFVRASASVARRFGMTTRLAAARASHHSRTTGRLAAALVTLMIATGVASGVLAATVGQTDLRQASGRVLTLPGAQDGDPDLVRRMVSDAAGSSEVIEVQAVRSDGSTGAISGVGEMRPDDVEYTLRVSQADAPSVAAHIAEQWPTVPALFVDAHVAGDRNARLMGAATLFALATSVLLLILATGLSMLALQEQRSDADHALLAGGLGGRRLSVVRGAEVLLTTLPAPTIAAAIGISIAVGVMHIDHTSITPPFDHLSLLLLVPAGMSVALACVAWLTSPSGRSIRLRRD